MEENITYPHDIACQITEILNIRELEELKKEMQQEHLTLNRRCNRLPVFIDFIKSGRIPNLSPVLLNEIKQERCKILIRSSLNEPTFEAFNVLEVSGLPLDKTTIFSSTATANSGNDDAVTTALDILGWCRPEKGIVYERSSTVTAATGRTAVSDVPPKNPAVVFRQDCPLADWHEMSYDIACQFWKMSTGIKECDKPHIVHKYDHMYHWGCINQCVLASPLGHGVSCWSMHEKWNIVMTMAMMWHAIMTLKTAGQLCIKVRIFKRAETLGLVSLISCLFEKTEFVDNSRQCCTCVAVIFSGITSDDNFRMKIANILRDAMDQDICKIFMNEVQQSNLKCVETLRECTLHRESMQYARARHNTIFLVGLYCMKELINSRFKGRNTRQLSTCLEKLKSMTNGYYGALGEKFYQAFIQIEENMHPDYRLALDIILNSQWMKINF